MNKESAAPTNKMQAVGISGAVTIVLMYLAGLASIEVPPEVAAAVTTIIAFVSGYLTREK